MLHISLFSGIGGFDLASEWIGWKNIVSCEINPFSRKVLQYYWPNSYHHDDIHTLTYEKINQELTKKYGSNWRTNDIILTGGFPCQPYSLAGKRKGKDDDRHLWPEMLRAIREIQPTWVVGENVRGLINWNGGMVFDEVQADLEAEEYEVIPFILPACGVNAPHRRDRVWFIAYSDNARRSTRLRQVSGANEEVPKRNKDAKSYYTTCKSFTDSEIIRLEPKMAIGKLGRKIRFKFSPQWDKWNEISVESGLCSRDDGLPRKLDGITFSKWRNESIKAAGNAVVPQVVLQIFRAIQAVNDAHGQPKQ